MKIEKHYTIKNIAMKGHVIKDIFKNNSKTVFVEEARQIKKEICVQKKLT